MTQHHDPVHPDEGDLDPTDDAYVTGLLAALPAVAMPADVAARLDAALAALGPFAADPIPADPIDAEPIAAPTVVPISAAPSHPSRWRNPRLLQAAAGLVLVVAAGVVGVKALSSHSSSDESTDYGAAASAPQAQALVLRTNHAYSEATLATDVHRLVSGKIAPFGLESSTAGGASPEQTPAAPAPSAGTPISASAEASTTPVPKAIAPALTALTANATSLAPCIALIEDGLLTAVAPIAVDAGTYDGQPALIVVLPGSDDPNSYDVWIVGPTCGKNKDAALIRYQSVPRS